MNPNSGIDASTGSDAGMGADAGIDSAAGVRCSSDSQSLSFDGSQASVSSTAPIGLGPQATITAEFWAKFTALSSTQDLMNIHNGDNLDLYVEIQNDTVFCNFLTQPAVSFSGLQTNTWYHIACTKDADSLSLFVDGQLQATGAWTGSPLLDDYMTVSGFEDKYLTGVVDEVKISTGAYTANFTPDTHLNADQATVLLWCFDEGQGTTSSDLSGNGLDAVLGKLGIEDRSLPNWVASDR